MPVKKAAKPTFTVQVKATLILDVEVEAGNLAESLELAKTLKRSELLSLEDGVSICDDKFETVGVWSQKAWSTE